MPKINNDVKLPSCGLSRQGGCLGASSGRNEEGQHLTAKVTSCSICFLLGLMLFLEHLEVLQG